MPISFCTHCRKSVETVRERDMIQCKSCFFCWKNPLTDAEGHMKDIFPGLFSKK